MSRAVSESFYDSKLFSTAEEGLIANIGVPVIYYEEIYNRLLMSVDDVVTYEGGYLYMTTPTKVFVDNWTIPKRITVSDLGAAFRLAIENKIGRYRNVNALKLYRVDRDGLNRYLRVHPEQHQPIHADTVYGVREILEDIGELGEDYILVAFNTVKMTPINVVV
jgi:hypothetical protein